jgi:hypothetical protein
MISEEKMMELSVQRAEYFYANVDDTSGVAYGLLELFKKNGVSLVAFTAFPAGPGRSQIDFFPESAKKLKAVLADVGISIVGPKNAFLVQGVNDVGALVEQHRKLSDAGINVHAANGVADGSGRFGYVLWVNPDDYERAAQVLGV